MSKHLKIQDINQLEAILIKLILKWKRQYRGAGGACCQSQAILEAKDQTSTDCAKEIQELFSEEKSNE